jgi:hypothetical protein
MTMITERQSEAVETAADGTRMPRTGALYLVAVRGEALLVDLSALGSRLWCF